MIRFFEKKIIYAIYVIMTLSIVTIIVGSFFNRIDCDSSIILTEMERIYEGYVPYQTMHLNYPPLWFYFNVFIKWIFDVPYGEYHFYLAVHWLFVIGCASCIYLISSRIIENRFISILSVWLFFIMSHWLQGNSVLFEIPSLFWGLLSITMAYKYEHKNPALYVIIGIVACCSFLTKQFGLGFCLLTLWVLIVSNSKNKIQKIGFYILGYLIPLVVCYALWGTSIFKSTLFNGYGMDNINLYYGDSVSVVDKVQRIFFNLLHFCNRISPLLYLSIFLIPFIVKNDKWKEFCLCWFAISGFMLQYWFAGGNHYYLYIVPFAVLLIPILLSLDINGPLKCSIYVFILITIILNSWSTFYNRVWKIYCHDGRTDLETQYDIGRKVAYITNGKTVFIPHSGIVYLYYTGNLQVANMAEVGYANGPLEIDVNTCTNQIYSADYIIHFSESLMRELYPDNDDFEFYFTDSLKKYVDTFPGDTIAPHVLIHNLKR